MKVLRYQSWILKKCNCTESHHFASSSSFFNFFFLNLFFWERLWWSSDCYLQWSFGCQSCEPKDWRFTWTDSTKSELCIITEHYSRANLENRRMPIKVMSCKVTEQTEAVDHSRWRNLLGSWDCGEIEVPFKPKETFPPEREEKKRVSSKVKPPVNLFSFYHLICAAGNQGAQPEGVLHNRRKVHIEEVLLLQQDQHQQLFGFCLPIPPHHCGRGADMSAGAADKGKTRGAFTGRIVQQANVQSTICAVVTVLRTASRRWGASAKDWRPWKEKWWGWTAVTTSCWWRRRHCASWKGRKDNWSKRLAPNRTGRDFVSNKKYLFSLHNCV